MKYIRKTSKDITHDFLSELLADRNMNFGENPTLFFHPSWENELPSTDLDNIQEGYELLKKHIHNGSKMFICVDSDVDGFTSAALVYCFLMNTYGVKYQISIDYHVPEGKEHGLRTLMDMFTKEKICDLIILPDSSSNDYEEHKILKDMGYDILVLDHHEADHYSENAIVINNQLSKNYENKSLSGVGVAYKFLEYFEHAFESDLISTMGEDGIYEAEGWEPHIQDYIDLVALGEISDMMNMNTLENRWFCEEGLSHINNGFFKELVAKQSYSLGDGPLTQIGIAFYITPLINALIRVGSDLEKERLFEAFLMPQKIVPSTKRGEKGQTETLATQSARNCVNAKSRQKREMDKATQLLDVQIINNDLDNNKILILNADDLNVSTTLTGLCAMNVAAAHKKPVMLGRISPDGYLKGSIRGRGESELKDFRAFLLESGLMDYVEGHGNAAGFSIKQSNVDKLTAYANEKLKDINFNEGYYEADFVVQGNCSYLADMITDLERGRSLWGQQNDEPIIIVKDITLDVKDIQAIGSYKDTLKFTFNGITYVKFKAKALLDELFLKSGKINITIAGRGNINNWGGKLTPQILLDEMEIKECSEEDF